MLTPTPTFSIPNAPSVTAMPTLLPAPTVTGEARNEEAWDTLTVTETAPVVVTAVLTPTATPRPPPRPTPQGFYTRVPLLMYHHIAIPPPNADVIRLDLSVWPERFEEQLAYFAGQGYQTVTLQAVYDAVVKRTPLPPKSIVLTFDDGYDDNYVNALPLLKKYNFIGTFYIATGLIGRAGYMTWEQVAGLAQAGMDVQSHSISHPNLPGKKLAFVRKELAESKQRLEAVTGRPVLFFCYPGGAYDAQTIQVLQEVGYLSATTTKPGARQYEVAPYEWPRVRVRGADRLVDLTKRLREVGAAGSE